MKNNVIDIGSELDIKISWVEKLKTDYSSVHGAEKTVQELAKILGGLQAINDGMKKLSAGGNLNSMQSYAGKVEKLMSRLAKINMPKLPDKSYVLDKLGQRPNQKNVSLPKYWEQDKKNQKYTMNQTAMRKDLYDKNFEKLSNKYPAGTFKSIISERANALTDKELPALIKKSQKEFDKELLRAQKRFDAELRAYDAKAVSLHKDYDRIVKSAVKRIEIINSLTKKYSDELLLIQNKLQETLAKKKEIGGLRDISAKEKKQNAKDNKSFNVIADKQRREEEEALRKRIEQQLKEEDAAQYRTHQESVKEQRKQAIYQAKKEAKLAGMSEGTPISDPSKLKTTEEIRVQLALRKQLLKISKDDVAEAQRAVNLAVTQKKSQEEIARKTLALQLAIRTANDDEKRLEAVRARGKEIAKQEREEIAASARRRKENNELIKHLLREKRERAEIATRTEKLKSIVYGIGSGSKLTFRQALDEIRKINFELKRMPESVKSAKIDEIQKSLAIAGLNTKRIGNNLQLVSAGSQKVEGHISKILRDMFSWEKILNRVSFVLTAVSSYEIFDAIKRAISSAIRLNIEFQEEMSKTYAIMEDRSESAKRKLSKDVKSLAHQYKLSLKEASEGIYEVISAQIKMQDSTAVLEAAMKLAVGGFSNLKDATLALVQILNAYDMEKEAGRAMHVADVAFETTRLGIITTQQYAEQMSKVGSTASMFGISIEEISAAISVMTRNGVRVEQAFTSLNQLLLTIANPTEEAKKTMDAYGVSLDMNAVRAKGLVNALLDLGPILESEEAMTNIVKSRTGAKALFSLVQNSQDYVDDLVAMYNSEGAASEATQERLSTTASMLKAVSASLNEISIQIGSALDPTIRSMLGFANNAIRVLTRNVWVAFSTIGGMLSSFVTIKVIVPILTRIYSLIASIRLSIKSANINGMLGGIPKLLRAIVIYLNSVKISAHTAGIALKTAWAEATLGLSVLITGLFELFGWLGNVAKRASDARIDKALGTKNAEANISKISKEVEVLDSKIAAIEGIYKMSKQADALYKSIGNDVKQTENFNKVHNKTVEAINKVLNMQINASEVRGRLYKYEESFELAYIRLQEQKIKNEIALLKAKQASGTADLLKSMGARPGNPFTREDRYGQLSFAGQADAWLTKMKSELSNVNQLIIGLDETASNAQIGAVQHRISKLENEIKAGNKVYGKDKVAGDKTYNMLENLAGASLFLSQLQENQFSMIGGFKLPDFPGISENVKELGSAAGEMHDKVKDVIDRYTDMFRDFGISYDSKASEKLRDIQDAIAVMRESANNILNDTVIDALNSLGNFSVKFGEMSEIFKKKSRTFDDVSSNLKRLQVLMSEVKTEDINQYVQKLKGTGIPELEKLAEHLPDAILDAIDNNAEEIEGYLDKQIGELIRKAKTDEQKIELSQRALSLNKMLFDNVVGASLDELEKIVEDERTPESSKVAIKHEITKKKKNLANAIRAMAGSYAGFLGDIEENINDIRDTFGIVRDKIIDAGGDPSIIDSMIRAYSNRDVSAQEKFFEMAKTGKIPQLTEPNPEDPNTLFKGNVTPTIGDYLSAVDKGIGKEYLEHFIKIYEGKIASPMQDFINGMKNELPKRIEEIDAEIAKDILWTRQMGRQTKDWQQNPEAVRYKQLREMKNKTPEQLAELSNLDAKWRDVSARIKTNQDASSIYRGLSTNFNSTMAMSNVPKSFDEFKESMESMFKDKLTKDGYFDMSTKQKRKYMYNQMKQQPGDIPFSDLFKKDDLTGKPVVSGGQVSDVIMAQLGLDKEFTIGEAFQLASSKIIEVSSQAWNSYWQNRIDMAEKARDRLLKVEDDYMEKMQANADAMNANDNTSAEQKEAINKRLEEQKRKSEERKQKIQEKYDKKAAETKRRQAQWELGITYAKAIAEIWARELGSKGAGIGTVSAVVLTGVLAGIFGTQMAMIASQKFAGGGYTGEGRGRSDSTGKRPVGIVHEKEFVYPDYMVSKYYNEFATLYSMLRDGKSFGSFVSSYMSGNAKPRIPVVSKAGSYANGGYVRNIGQQFGEPVSIEINLTGARVIDDVELHRRVQVGGRKRRYING